MANFKVKAGTFQGSGTAYQSDCIPLGNGIPCLLQQLRTVSRNSECVISMVDDHDIPKPFKPISIEDFPREDRFNFSSRRGLDFNSILPPFFKKTDHLPLNGWV